MRLRGLIVLMMLVRGGVAAAHDFWIEPSTFRPAVNETATVSLLVGQNFTGDPLPRTTRLIDAFTVRDGAGTRPVGGFENQDPAGYLRVERAGDAIVGYSSKASPLELTPEKFAQFLRDEGLSGFPIEPVHRERFYRYAKALLVAGGGRATNYAQPLGYRFEIVPLSNPMDNAPLRVQVMFEGKPLPNALVTALHRDDANAHVAGRTDKRGIVTLALPKGGVWLVKSVQLVRANPDWESLWASLTFER